MTSARTTTRRPAAACGRPAPRRTSGRAPRRTTGSTRRRATGRARPAGRGYRSPRRWQEWAPLGLVVLAALIGLAWSTGPSPHAAAVTPAPGRCTLAGAPFTLSPEQAANATTIATVARARHLPTRALVIALATAKQESGLRNLHYGDRDSLGLFQQRPSQGWGTPAQILDPTYAAGRFFDHLVRVPDWQTRPVTEAAQVVQRSAYPGAYARWEPMAAELAAALESGRLRCAG
jgi:hypothetical protein